ncbi:hypothetical protein [Mycobacterium aquaticum]|uniref:hypothetical protein n=1 Tax=Mycobacterium aquaticum TaxID=1927124 RepID=UPI00114E94C1|nr:hypothetical protein [Mycobacterium aquaticum]
MQGYRLRIRCGLRRENFSETLAALTENFPPETVHYAPPLAVTSLPETEKERQQTPMTAMIDASSRTPTFRPINDRKPQQSSFV